MKTAIIKRDPRKDCICLYAETDDGGRMDFYPQGSDEEKCLWAFMTKLFNAGFAVGLATGGLCQVGELRSEDN